MKKLISSIELVFLLILLFIHFIGWITKSGILLGWYWISNKEKYYKFKIDYEL